MTNISGGPKPTFSPNTVLEALKLNEATKNWVATEVPADDQGNIGDVVFVTGPGDGGSPVGPAPGLVHLHTESWLTGESEHAVDNVFSGTYDYYVVQMSGVASTDVLLDINFRSGGADDSTNNYVRQTFASYSNDFLNERVGPSGSAQVSSWGASENGTTLTIFNPADATKPTMARAETSTSMDTIRYYLSAIRYVQSKSFDGFRLSLNTGSFTGTFSVYGYSEGGN